MTKSEYMRELESGLRNGNISNVEEVLADFEDHFNEALAAGQDETEICEMLGDPAEIAEQYTEENPVQPPFPTPASPPAVASINIDLYQSSLECRPLLAGQTDFTVEIYQNGIRIEDEDIHVSAVDGGLQIMQQRPANFVELLFHGFLLKKVVVGIPVRFAGDVHLKTTHGNIRLNGVEIGGALNIGMSSGNIKCEDVAVAGDFTIASHSGNIGTKKCRGELTATLFSGNIDIEAHSGSVSGSSTSGNVHIETDRMTRPCTLETKSGNIHLEAGALESDLEVNDISGNIHLRIEKLAGNLAGKTKSGNIRASFGADTNAVFLLQPSGVKNDFDSAYVPQAGIPTVRLSTRSGSVRVKRI